MPQQRPNLIAKADEVIA